MKSSKLPIYLDSHATTPMDPEVLDLVMDVMREDYGNAASPHHVYGTQAKFIVEKARQQVASLIGARAEEIIFTSGATESNNMAILGIAKLFKDKGNHIIISAIEHVSVLEVCGHLEKEGFRITTLAVDSQGLVNPQAVEQAIESDTILVSVMTANNEIGTIQPIREIAKIARQHQVLFHTDAAQAVGKIPMDVDADCIDLMSLSAHKMYGPKGIGALYIRQKNPRARLEPAFFGGGHEQGLRPGTLNVPGIAGFGKACELSAEFMPSESIRIAELRDKLKLGIHVGLDGVLVNGSMDKRLPHNLNLSFTYVDGESLMKSFETIAVSSSSACTSVNIEVSHVLKVLGLKEDMIHSSIRFGLSRFTTDAEINIAIEEVIRNVTHLREMSAFYNLTLQGMDDVQLARKPGEREIV